MDLAGPKYKTSHLALIYVGNQSANDWKNHPERLNRVIKAISLCTLADSLETIDVYNWGMDVEKVKKMLEEFGLENKIKVVQEGIASLNE